MVANDRIQGVIKKWLKIVNIKKPITHKQLINHKKRNQIANNNINVYVRTQ